MEVSSTSSSDKDIGNQTVDNTKNIKQFQSKSKFGKFFEIIKKNKNVFGYCKLCEQQTKKQIEIQMKNRNTTGLKKHLLSMHKREYHKLFPPKSSSSIYNFVKQTGQANILILQPRELKNLEYTLVNFSLEKFFDKPRSLIHLKCLYVLSNVIKENDILIKTLSKSRFVLNLICLYSTLNLLQGHTTGKNGTSGASKSKHFTNATVDWITKKYLPFSFFDDNETRSYFNLLNPNITLPNRFALRQQVKNRFEELRESLKMELKECHSKISYTIDGWTSIAGKSFFGVTAHYIDRDWNYKSRVLDFIPSHGRHTGADIASIFYECLHDMDLKNKILGITVDNASANTSFICIAHILNLGVQDLLKNLMLSTQDEDSEDEDEENDNVNENDIKLIEDSSTAIAKVRSIFSKLKRSEKLRNQFSSICETVGIQNILSPILDCPTRWGSTFNMLGVAIKLKKEKWVIMEKVNKILINFHLLTTKLGGENYATLPLVIVSFNLLLDKLENMIKQLDVNLNRNKIDEKLILAYQAARDKMLKHYKKTNWIYCAILILDPIHKLKTFELTNWGRELKRKSFEKFKTFYAEYFSQKSVPIAVKEIYQEKMSSDEDIIDFNKLYSGPSTSTASQKFIDELEEYLSQPRVGCNEDILQWWKRHEIQFPVLAKMARDYLAIPATSVPAERLFSKASLIIRKHRNRLNNESA
ncbi:uncharacterized protein [Prorops nasuta]|uniref:uncharacterized protein n=1 Tax=Prorops nasuta TaxID=863751 RepID=UPI0034CFEC77